LKGLNQFSFTLSKIYRSIFAYNNIFRNLRAIRKRVVNGFQNIRDWKNPIKNTT